MAEFGPMANMQIDEESNLNIFEMFVEISEPTKEVVNKELQMFKRFQVNVEDIKCLLKWWEKHESMFPIVAFLIH
jgi:hypothetical protein